MYIVKVDIPFGIDDSYYCEYSGIEHITREEAEKELNQAKKDKNINYACIEEME